jgi:hypothetical protein
MYAVMLRYAEFMMEVEKQREAGGMTIDQMVDEAKNNPDKTVCFEKGRLVYVSSGIMLEDLEVRDGRADYAGWGKRMDKRFGQSLGWDFGGYGEQGNGGSSAGKIMAGTLLLGATTSELPPVAAAVVVGGTIIAGGAYIYDNWDGIVDGVTTAGESISDVWRWIKGERGKTAKSDGTNNPWKHTKPHPNNPNRILEKDGHTGKWKDKPKPSGWEDWWNNR